MTSPLFQQFLSLWSCTKTCHSPWDHYQRSKGELLVRKNVEIRQQVGDATWISWEAETNLVILVTFPGFLLFFSYRNLFRDSKSRPWKQPQQGCLRAGRSQGGLSLSQSLPALDMLDPNGFYTAWTRRSIRLEMRLNLPIQPRSAPSSFIEFLPNPQILV